MTELYTYHDADGATLAKGVRVRDALEPSLVGTVAAISDPDGDMRDGVMVGIPPTIRVQWDGEAESEWFTMSWTAKGPGDDDAPYVCEDIAVIGAGS